MTVQEKLAKIIKEIPEDMASQVFDFAMYLKTKRSDEQEAAALANSPAFKKLARRSLKEIDSGQVMSLDELKKEVGR